jgi:hypothetical protein
MEIKPTYVTWEQAKLLKEKGFGVPYKQMGYTTKFYNANTKTMLALGRTGRSTNLIPAPEQHQVVEWLRITHDIWITVGVGNLFHKDKFYILIKEYNIDRWNLTSLTNDLHSPYDSPQEAYSAAFDYVLKELI